MIEKSRLNIAYLPKVLEIQDGVDKHPEKVAIINPSEESGTGGFALMLPDLVDANEFKGALEQIIPKVLDDLDGIPRQRNTFVIFVPIIDENVYHTASETKILTGENNLLDDDWRIIAVSIYGLRSNQEKYPNTPWYISALETILHELYEENMVSNDNEEPQSRKQTGYVQSPLETKARRLALEKINNCLGVEAKSDEYGFIYVERING